MTTKPLAIEARNLTKSYGETHVLKGIDIEVPEGTIFSLLGPNGAGKTTTVNILSTLIPASGGEARVGGDDVARSADDVRKAIGVTGQFAAVDGLLTGRENLHLMGRLNHLPKQEIRRRTEDLLERFDLVDAAKRPPATYSGGMKRRLDVAMGLVQRPAVLFLDEPTTGLDPETRAILWQDLQRLRREQNLAVLLTTHYLEEADQLCDRVAIIDHGRIVVEGTPGELKAGIRGDAVTLEVDTETSVVAAAIRPLDGVLDVIPNGSSVIARVTQGATAIPALVTALEQQGVAVQSVSLSRPSLDDVYLHHTGHRFSATATNGSATSGESGREGHA
jgi:ABC-2 type transport system ATP-binding protein